MEDNIIQLDTIRIERNKPRKCICDPYEKKFTVDTVNREVTCKCGLVVDPYEALEHLARYHNRMNEQHKSMNEQRQQWLKEKPHSVLFKRLEQRYKRGEMLPFCPSCGDMIDFKEITSFGNSMFYKKSMKKDGV